MRHKIRICGFLSNSVPLGGAVVRQAGPPSLYWDVAPNFPLGLTLAIPSGFVSDLTYHILHKLKNDDIMHFVFNGI